MGFFLLISRNILNELAPPTTTAASTTCTSWTSLIHFHWVMHHTLLWRGENNMQNHNSLHIQPGFLQNFTSKTPTGFSTRLSKPQPLFCCCCSTWLGGSLLLNSDRENQSHQTKLGVQLWLAFIFPTQPQASSERFLCLAFPSALAHCFSIIFHFVFIHFKY